MSPKKKKKKLLIKKAVSSKKTSGRTRRKNREAELQKKILPFTAARLPSVARSLPDAASAVPLVSKEIPCVAKTIPHFSAISNVTIPRQWGKMPSKKWGASKIRTTRKRKVKRPEDISVFNFLGKVITAPYQPVEMVKGLTSAIHSQAEEEKDPKIVLGQKLLRLKMRREMGKISDEDYKIEETKLKRRIKNLEEKEGVQQQIREKPKKKKNPRGKRG